MVMNIRVLTPDRVICSTTADEVVLPGLTGQVGVLTGHAALITALDTGLLRIKLEEKWTPIILCGGLAEIDRNRVTVLVNDVEELIDIQLSEATQELEEATSAVEAAESEKSLLDASVENTPEPIRVDCTSFCVNDATPSAVKSPLAFTIPSRRYFPSDCMHKLLFSGMVSLTSQSIIFSISSLITPSIIPLPANSPSPVML